MTEWVAPSSGWEVGAVFRAVNQREDTRWEVECHVTVADRPQEMGWTVLEPHHPSSTWWYRLDAIGDETEVTVGFQHGPNISGLRMAIDRRPDRAEDIIAGRIAELRSNMRHTLERVRELAEAPAT